MILRECYAPSFHLILNVMGMSQEEAYYKANQENIDFQKEANELNRQFASDQNLQNHTWEQEAREAEQKFAIEQFERENAEWWKRQADERAYTDPTAQLMRLKNAGINPSLVDLDGNGSSYTGSVGNAATPSVAPTTGISPNMVAPHVEPEFSGQLSETEQMLLQSMSQVQGFVQTYFDADNKASGSALNKQLFDFNANANPKKLLQVVEDYRKAVFDSDRSDAERQIAALQYQYLSDTLNARAKGVSLQNTVADTYAKMMGQQILSMQAHDAYEQLMGDVNVKRLKLDERTGTALIAEVWQKIDNMKSEKKLTEAQVLHEVENTVKTYFESVGQVLSNEQAAELAPLITTSYEKHIRQQGADYWNPFRYAGQALGGSAAQGIKMFVK